MSNPTITLDATLIQQLVDQAVEANILSAIENLGKDPVWLEKIERMINQAVVDRTIAGLNSIDIGSVIQQRVDENMKNVRTTLVEDFSSTGISDRATECQFTIMDEATVVKNHLIAQDMEVVGSATVKDLAVKGSINTDNQAWNDLSTHIANKTLDQLTETWKDQLVESIANQIKSNGIDFQNITVDGDPLISGNTLSQNITESSLQSVGTLKQLRVRGTSHFNETLNVIRGRVGVNTEEPEMAFSVWDEEISLLLGKHKAKQAYIGTGRDQSLTLGVNRTPYLEIDNDGMTTVKKLRIGLHRVQFDSQVPGWSGTRGDLVFNSSPGSDRVFAWVCLGAFRWQPLKSAE